MALIAKRNVLYAGRMYRPGEKLPGYDRRMAEAWLRAGSAVRTEEKPTAEPVCEPDSGDSTEAAPPAAEPAHEPDGKGTASKAGTKGKRGGAR